MPPTRTAPRVAVLGSTAQRPVTSAYQARKGNALRRRVVVAVLALVSLALLTAYYRESPSGALHDAQGLGATAIGPFEVGAERVVRPFRDAYGWFDDLLTAKSENAKLRAQLRDAQQQAALNATAALDAVQLKKLYRVNDLPSYLHDYVPINAAVAARGDTAFDEDLVIRAGSDQGVRRFAPVVTKDGLVGYVSLVSSHLSKVTLVTDPESAVAALDPKTRAWGIVQHGQGDPDSLVVNRVDVSERIYRTDPIVTAGSSIGGDWPSIYPRGIRIGTVLSVGQTDVKVYKDVQVTPAVDFSNLEFVTVLKLRDRSARRR